MPPRVRRFVAAIGVLVFLVFYVWAVIGVGDRLPDSPWIDLLFYGVAGTAWGLPLIPLLRWAERGNSGK
ncbi:DUF2842 domain-containing protein [uncultured Brevundimonas sp.]|uniref:DUF2842 domain-containing protein n=1 Tax=uncultured Brevundimonas sp. TaxID=213418 RepID=UPI0030ED30C1|tara:strand:- start:61987 stop:62193 length:207 start_codon:yes stop_codon:yes gene_type:complete